MLGRIHRNRDPPAGQITCGINKPWVWNLDCVISWLDITVWETAVLTLLVTNVRHFIIWLSIGWILSCLLLIIVIEGLSFYQLWTLIGTESVCLQ